MSYKEDRQRERGLFKEEGEEERRRCEERVRLIGSGVDEAEEDAGTEDGSCCSCCVL